MVRLSVEELQDILRRARGGCSESLGKLLESYRSYLALIARLQLGQQLQAKCSPSDIVQETFLQAGRDFGRFEGKGEGELVTWLRKILASQLATQVRHFGTQRRNIQLERQLFVELNQSSVLLCEVFANRVKSPSQSAIRREQAVIFADALSQLSAEYREVIVLRHLQRLKFPEIAQRMDRSVDGVRAIWQRALRKLRVLLGDEFA